MNAFKSSILTGYSSSNGAVNELFSATSKQVLVRDDVVFAPSIDPYLALNEANKRLKAGLSLFSNTINAANPAQPEELADAEAK